MFRQDSATPPPVMPSPTRDASTYPCQMKGCGARSSAGRDVKTRRWYCLSCFTGNKELKVAPGSDVAVAVRTSTPPPASASRRLQLSDPRGDVSVRSHSGTYVPRADHADAAAGAHEDPTTDADAAAVPAPAHAPAPHRNAHRLVLDARVGHAPWSRRRWADPAKRMGDLCLLFIEAADYRYDLPPTPPNAVVVQHMTGKLCAECKERPALYTVFTDGDRWFDAEYCTVCADDIASMPRKLTGGAMNTLMILMKGKSKEVVDLDKLPGGIGRAGGTVAKALSLAQSLMFCTLAQHNTGTGLSTAIPKWLNSLNRKAVAIGGQFSPEACATLLAPFSSLFYLSRVSAAEQYNQVSGDIFPAVVSTAMASEARNVKYYTMQQRLKVTWPKSQADALSVVAKSCPNVTTLRLKRCGTVAGFQLLTTVLLTEASDEHVDALVKGSGKTLRKLNLPPSATLTKKGLLRLGHMGALTELKLVSNQAMTDDVLVGWSARDSGGSLLQSLCSLHLRANMVSSQGLVALVGAARSLSSLVFEQRGKRALRVDEAVVPVLVAHPLLEVVRLRATLDANDEAQLRRGIQCLKQLVIKQ